MMIMETSMATHDNDLRPAFLMCAQVLVRDVLGVTSDRFDLSANAMLVDDLGADSLDMVEMQVLIEERGISAPDEAFFASMTMGHLAKIIENGACEACNGSGEIIFNRSLSQDPINDSGKPCESCDGSGNVRKSVHQRNSPSALS
ncbi:hypothetical protein ASE85_02350 [Sphingobium sp. Leaf26]|nr:hypothetical protein ASE85_02350 [Sphingobium sp. Leaf26]